jgi:hypothetical protein
MPAILATWEAEIRRTVVSGQLRKIVLKGDLHLQNNQSKMDWVVAQSVGYLLCKHKA